MLRPEFVARKLQLIAEDLARLVEFRDDTYEELATDSLRLAALERILERMVLRAIDVNEHLIGALATGQEAKATRLTYRETFLRLADYGVYPDRSRALHRLRRVRGAVRGGPWVGSARRLIRIA